MNIYPPLTLRQRLEKAKADNRTLQDKLVEVQAERHQLLIDHAVANIKAERATARADALEKANDELRADLSSWLDKAVSSDG